MVSGAFIDNMHSCDIVTDSNLGFLAPNDTKSLSWTHFRSSVFIYVWNEFVIKSIMHKTRSPLLTRDGFRNIKDSWTAWGGRWGPSGDDPGPRAKLEEELLVWFDAINFTHEQIVQGCFGSSLGHHVCRVKHSGHGTTRWRCDLLNCFCFKGWYPLFSLHNNAF